MNSIKDLLQKVYDNPNITVQLYSVPYNHAIRVMVRTATQQSGHEFRLDDLYQRADADELISAVINQMIEDVHL